MTVIKRNTSSNILASISEFSVSVVIIVLIVILIINFTKESSDYRYNIVEFKAQYKNYIIVDKYVDHNTYVFKLKNPVTNSTQEANVKDYLYYNAYFVGDTIK